MSLSVIVPIYNIEKYLSKCIESILMQTYDDYELILVNDGSTDNSLKICNKYSQENEKIKVINKENGGAADARNLGLKNANKEYVFFIDSDDFLDDSQAFEKIISRLNKTKADVLNLGFKKYYEDTKEKKTYFKLNENMPLNIYSTEKSFDFIIKNNLYIASPWNKIIKRDILQENKLEFIKGIYSEDIEWCNRLAIICKRFDYLSEDFYCYRQIKTSISKNIKTKNIKDLKYSIVTCCEQLKNLPKNDQLNLLSYISYQYGTFLVCQAMVTYYNDEINSYINEMKNYKFLLKYGNNKKIKILYVVEKIMGYKNMCKLLRFLYKFN